MNRFPALQHAMKISTLANRCLTEQQHDQVIRRFIPDRVMAKDSRPWVHTCVPARADNSPHGGLLLRQ
jgi:hypothetical protein